MDDLRLLTDRAAARELGELLLAQFREPDAWLGRVFDTLPEEERRQARLCVGTIMGEIQLTGLVPLFNAVPGLQDEIWPELRGSDDC